MSPLKTIKAQALVHEATQRLAQQDTRAAQILLHKALTFAPDLPEALAFQEYMSAQHTPWYSVVIPTCNRQDILVQCLHCIEQQTLSPTEFEVLVVDDASVDGTANFLAHYSPPYAFRHILLTQRGGPARARNAGIRCAQGAIVHFLNDDALIEPTVLQRHYTLHKALADTPVSVLGHFDFGPPFTETLWGYTLQNSDLLFRYPTFTHNGLHGHQSYYSCNISTPRNALIQAGLFDESFTGNFWGAEDMELGMRLAAQPTPVMFRDDSRSVHVHDVGVEGLARTAMVRGGGAVWLFAKHGGNPHYAQLKAQDVAYWRNLPPRITERVQQLHAVLAKTEHMRLVDDGSPAPYLRREDYADMCRCCFGLWPLRTRELLRIIDEVEKEALVVLDAAKGACLQQCAPALYPAMLFIRFFHDTIGVCAVDAIRHFCPDAAPLAVSTTPAPAAPGTPVALEPDTPSAPADSAPADSAPASRAKRILLACNFFWPSVGGTELFVERMGRELQALGHHVEIACRWLENRSTASLHGMPIHSFHCHGKFTDGRMGPDTERYRALVCKGSYDVVIALAHPDNWVCHLLRDLPESRPRIIMLPSINAENMQHWRALGVMDTIVETLRQTDMCVSVSQSGHDNALFSSLEIPYMFIPHSVTPQPVPYDMRECLGLPPRCRLLACVGNFWPVKNQLALLQRFTAMPADLRNDWRLVLAGGALPWDEEKHFFSQCWELAQKDARLRILGPLPQAEATALIRDADILLVPSRGESAGPLVVLEAMSQSTPWIATPPCNAVHDEGGGIIAPLEDFPRVAMALLSRPDLAANLARNGYEHWERCFRWDVARPLFDALIRNQPTTQNMTMPEDLRGQRDALHLQVASLLNSTSSTGIE